MLKGEQPPGHLPGNQLAWAYWPGPCASPAEPGEGCGEVTVVALGKEGDCKWM